MFARHWLCLSLSAAVVSLGACRPSDGFDEDPLPILSLSPDAAIIDQGGMLHLTVTATDADGNPLTPSYIDWSSSNLEVARVVGPATVQGQTEGRAWIGASWRGAYDAVEVTVIRTESCPSRAEPLTLNAVPCPVK